MQARTTLPAPTPDADADAAEDALCRAALRELVALGTDLARDVHAARQADPPLLTHEQAAAAFERAARAVRRTVLLIRHLRTPAAPDPRAALFAARARVIRVVEDAITREAREDPAARPRLEAEFAERLDAPELEHELLTRPVAEVITDICRDMDLGRLPFANLNWRRRQPADLRHLARRAAGLPGRVPEPPPAEPPVPRLDDADLARFLVPHRRE